MGNNHFCGSVLGDSVSGLKDDAGLAVEWSVDEQRKLEEGLSKFADEPSIMRYIKIATTMRDKTVRDVALRCKWMARLFGKNISILIVVCFQDNLVESSSKQSISSVPTLNVAPFPVTMSNRTQIDGMTFEALSGSIRHLLEQNNQLLGQISANISLMKLDYDRAAYARNKKVDKVAQKFGAEYEDVLNGSLGFGKYDDDKKI
ncbi:uncharacterized protein LOC110881168 [Helianthus annuus]|uniref:uncharacterized protein LOC110881168 n=1 Tax=Helianthus annuus TaxID=4232 RepID=UPI001652C4BB|nr:uncharacterized protein LOC110881168 [Helianthus annuus]